MASLTSDINILGYASRLPGAKSPDEFWSLLESGTCAVTSVSKDRWPLTRFGNPDGSVQGKAYTWAAGQLDDVWGFDPAFFGISPREAVQMDPQQRLLLQLVWEALEQANIRPSDLAGTSTGVYVGASSLDYHHRFVADPASADMQFMTGNTLSIVSNRISYIYDFRGPSFTVDTACSSSLVALHEAVSALESGAIDTAIVCGVSLLLSPFAFVGFSRATMLSPSGLCQAFDAKGDGYVRSEGGVVLVLQSDRAKPLSGSRPHAKLIATGINADGRTVGLSLPSAYAQADLLREIYEDRGVSPDDLAFVEAHGTGTRVGDPAETDALGKVIGQKRSDVLPIGSVKTNVGHLEPVSGLVGLLKALLALKHDVFPKSLHFETPNPDIPFDDLNLAVAKDNVPLKRGKKARLAGVNSFGFGGTNAHAVIADAPKMAVPAMTMPANAPLVLSAKSKDALKALAGRYREAINTAGPGSAARLVTAAAHARDLLDNRVVLMGDTVAEKNTAIDAFLSEEKSSLVVQGDAFKADAKVGFVFSGNGSQWAGMGQDAYQTDEVFQSVFERVDRIFMGIGGWSLLTTLFAKDLEADIERTEIAQPLLFAIQVALVESLRARGISPEGVAGHSVGEVAAAWCAGALSLEQAVKVIHARSSEQEVVRDLGSMAALLLPAEKAVEGIKASGLPRLELAAVNSPRSVTISGDSDSIDAFAKFARKNKWALRRLNLAYPFHSALVDSIKQPLLTALDGISPGRSDITFYSTVDPDAPAPSLDADYWWRNVRQPVQFQNAVARMVDDGFGVFVEIGPKAVLGTYMNDILRSDGKKAKVLASLDTPAKDQPVINPLPGIAALIVAHGGRTDLTKYVGPAARAYDQLPSYPWQNTPYRQEPTDERVDFMFGQTWPLLGYRLRQDAAEWYNHIDASAHPWLADHKVEESVVFPAAGFTEMAVRAVLRWTGQDTAELRDLDILRPLVIEDHETWETMVRISPDDRVVEIHSKPRLQDADWVLNARGHFVTPSTTNTAPSINVPDGDGTRLDKDRLYAITRDFDLNYGPAFQRADQVVRHDDTTATVDLGDRHPAVSDLQMALCPTLVDAGFHGLFALLQGVPDIPAQTSFLPIRMGALRVLVADAAPRSVRIKVTKASPRSIEAKFEYLDEAGQLIARLSQTRFRAVKLGRETRPDELVYRQIAALLPAADRAAPLNAVMPDGFEGFLKSSGFDAEALPDLDDSSLLVDALARTIVHETLWAFSVDDTLNIGGLAASGKLHETALPLAATLAAWLTESGLAEETEDGVFVLGNPDEQPNAGALMHTLVSEGGQHIAEASLLARLSADLSGLLSDGLASSAADFYAAGLFDAYLTASPAATHRSDCLTKLGTDLLSAWPGGAAARLLVIGAADLRLLQALDSTLDPTRMVVTVADVSASEAGRAARQWTGSTSTVFLESLEEDIEGQGPFDAVLFSRSLADLTEEVVSGLLKHLVADAMVLAAEPLPSPLTDLIRGIGTDWWSGSASAEFPVSRQSRDWVSVLSKCGYQNAVSQPLASPVVEADIVFAAAGGQQSDPDDETDAATAETKTASTIVLFSDETGGSRKLADGLAACLEREGIDTILAVPGDITQETENGHWTVRIDTPAEDDDTALKDLLGKVEGRLVHLAGVSSDGDDAMTVIARRTWSLTRLLTVMGADQGTVWVVAPGGAPASANGPDPDPAQGGVWAYGRVAMNEFPDAHIRLIDVSPSLEPGIAAARLSEELTSPTDEREVVLDGQQRSGLRIIQGGVLDRPELPDGSAPAMKLDILRQGALDQLAWTVVAKPEVDGAKVEIAVEASGLNFRDVMWALGLLPEEALEDGFAGPTLGMECCGRVVACGPDVTRFQPGDKVITFAPACFASHVTVDETACAPMPAAVSSEEAATIPVTFLTAYYALVHLAHLSEGETVLIHGGAGGVGLAALQIAQWRGAKVIATAGSPEKRNTLTLLGADVVLDSRSLAFVDAVMEETGGDGVDVVLNSLFGEAMERSIEVLKPFGRFLELGKRDYYGNTRIGLRPFRQNLTYFGIDADQLLTRQPKLAEALFEKLVTLFEDGTLAPLPYRAFDADNVVEAFRLMQQAGHIGKIVLRPPAVPDTVAPRQELTLRSDATYVVAGGFGGFGAALLHRLADKGATSIAVLSRRGDTSEDAQAVIAALGERGVAIRGYACDLSDPAQVETTLSEIRAGGRAIHGVFHTAMVLDDRLISNLDEAGISKVLAPKVQGADYLDRFTRGDPLDHFVLYSSATTLVGNPGQANYVAANGYLESLARKRRIEGRPGLAVAWGAISDAGYLARNEDVNEMLSRKLGRHALTAAEALDGLERLMVQPADDASLAALGYARIDWHSARKDLALVSTPVVDLLGLGSADDDTAGEGVVDLHALLEGLDKVAAAQTVAKLLAGEIGKILRVSPTEIDPHKPLSDIGMDSLMALELRMSAERQLGIDIPLMSLANGATLIDLSSRVANRVLGADSGDGLSSESQQLASQHFSEDIAETEGLSEVAEKVESKSKELGSFL